MSSTVRIRLAEIAERGRERRHRMGEIRTESSRIFERVHQLTEGSSDRWNRDQASSTGVLTQDVHQQRSAVLPDVQEPPDGGILGQVRHLLESADARAKAEWTDDDTCILLCLMEAWTAAARKGYTLEELQKVLQSLGPPQ